jgi:hypothetical protein
VNQIKGYSKRKGEKGRGERCGKDGNEIRMKGEYRYENVKKIEKKLQVDKLKREINAGEREIKARKELRSERTKRD